MCVFISQAFLTLDLIELLNYLKLISNYYRQFMSINQHDVTLECTINVILFYFHRKKN